MRNYDTDPELSVLLAREGVKAMAGPESEEVLRTALVRSRVQARHDPSAPVESVEISPTFLPRCGATRRTHGNS